MNIKYTTLQINPIEKNFNYNKIGLKITTWKITFAMYFDVRKQK